MLRSIAEIVLIGHTQKKQRIRKIIRLHRILGLKRLKDDTKLIKVTIMTVGNYKNDN